MDGFLLGINAAQDDVSWCHWLPRTASLASCLMGEDWWTNEDQPGCFMTMHIIHLTIAAMDYSLLVGPGCSSNGGPCLAIVWHPLPSPKLPSDLHSLHLWAALNLWRQVVKGSFTKVSQSSCDITPVLIGLQPVQVLGWHTASPVLWWDNNSMPAQRLTPPDSNPLLSHD